MATKKQLADETPPVDETPQVELVKMKRPDGEPNTADVHPDEVANYMACGWELVQ